FVCIGIEVSAGVGKVVPERVEYRRGADVLGKDVRRAAPLVVKQVVCVRLELHGYALGNFGVLENTEVDRVDRLTAQRIASHAQVWVAEEQRSSVVILYKVHRV